MSDREVSRRQFLVSGAVVAGYAVAAQPVFAEAIHTAADGLVTGTAEIPVAGGAMSAYFAAPKAVAAPQAALVVHEIFGVHEYIPSTWKSRIWLQCWASTARKTRGFPSIRCTRWAVA